MSQPFVETTTIVNESGKQIIIAHPPVKKQINYWELITEGYQSLKSAIQQVEETFESPVEEPIIVEASPLIVIDVQKPLQENKQPVPKWTSQIWADLTETFSRQNITLYKTKINQNIAKLDGIDDRLSRDITKFKQQNLIVLGDIRLRSILLGFSSALLYKIISFNSKGMYKKTRNFFGSFIFMGYWLTPQLFNPLLRRPDIASKII